MASFSSEMVIRLDDETREDVHKLIAALNRLADAMKPQEAPQLQADDLIYASAITASGITAGQINTGDN